MTDDAARSAARGWLGGRPPRALRRAGEGHIHRSYEVVGDGGEHLLLQRLNGAVFADLDALEANLAAVLTHLASDAAYRLRVPARARHASGAFVARESGSAWRAWQWIEGSISRAVPESARDAAAAGEAFGRFAASLARYEGPPLRETIPRFHDTPHRVARLAEALRAAPAERRTSARELPEVASASRELAEAIVAPAGGWRTLAHNDAKLGNVLLDGQGAPLAVIDLDTVMPGSPLHDLGDLLRSTASRAPEDAGDAVTVDDPLLEAAVRSWHAAAGDALTPALRALAPLAGAVIAYEQGVRFLTDHLEGDRYFPVTRPGQNADRARTQFALSAALRARAPRIARLVGAGPA